MNIYKKYFMTDQKLVLDITETYEQILGKDFPYETIDLVFVPNLFVGKKLKRRTLCYSGI